MSAARAAGVKRLLLARSDNGCAFVGADLRAGACLSVTTRANPSLTRAIAGIDENVRTPIRDPHAVYKRHRGPLGLRR